jgi:hypothetical protein
VKEEFQSKASEMMKKVLTVGVGAFFLTEESLRTLVADFKLPKELLSAVLESAGKTRDEFLRVLSKEMMSQVMEHVNPSELLDEIMKKHEIDLNIKISFNRKKDVPSSSEVSTSSTDSV